MREWGKYLMWKGKGRLRTGWIPLVLWLILDLIVAALPPELCTHISYEYPNLAHLLNWPFVLSAFLMVFYPVFVMGSSWFPPAVIWKSSPASRRKGRSWPGWR